MGKLKFFYCLIKLIKLQFHLKTHLRRNGKMGFANIWNSHPKKYGQGSRSCRACSNGHGLIRKYGLNMCRQCFHQYAKDIGSRRWTEEGEEGKNRRKEVSITSRDVPARLPTMRE